MKGESWRRKHVQGIIEEESCRRNHEEESGRRNQVGGIMEESGRRNHEGAIWEASGGHLGSIWEASTLGFPP